MMMRMMLAVVMMTHHHRHHHHHHHHCFFDRHHIEGVPCLLKSRSDKDKVRALLTPVKKGKFLEKNVAKWVLFKNPPPKKNPCFQKSKGKSQAKAKAEPKEGKKPDTVATKVEGGGDATLLHDMLGHVNECFAGLPPKVNEAVSASATERVGLWYVEFGLAGAAKMPLKFSDAIATNPDSYTGKYFAGSLWGKVRDHGKKLMEAYIDDKHESVLGTARKEKRKVDAAKTLPDDKSENKRRKKVKKDDPEDQDAGDQAGNESDTTREFSSEDEEEENDPDAKDECVDGAGVDATTLKMFDETAFERALCVVKDDKKLLTKCLALVRDNPPHVCSDDKIKLNILKRKHPALDRAAAAVWKHFDYGTKAHS
eukprot:8458930-Karenia_brevis.AAC.1